MELLASNNMPLTVAIQNVLIDVSDISHSSMQQLLVDQYRFTEEYCNATTALHNTIVEQQQQRSKPTTTTANDTTVDYAFQLRKCIDRYQQSILDIQNILQLLEQLVLAISRIKEQYHVGHSSNDVDDKNNEDELLLSSTTRTFIRLFNLTVLHDHIQRTYRILQTIYTLGEGTSYYYNGIMTPPPQQPIVTAATHLNQKINVKLVALATLRASIQIVKESLPP